jgi:hypothetical protein
MSNFVGVVENVALEAAIFTEEHCEDPRLLSVAVVLTVEDGDMIRTLTHTWPGKD